MSPLSLLCLLLAFYTISAEELSEATNEDNNAAELVEEKRSPLRNPYSWMKVKRAPRNPYSWMVGEQFKRARNPYSWMASEKSKRSLNFLDDNFRQPRNPYSWMYSMFEKRARNPYSWMNYE
ncbi:unnamed protein product [Cylicocyclus nassatus]|uniref:Uncharacterized protein n=1 Tax=Cylicocyclus nassatus TaxID=53992 RepID=A0AA36GIL7_CYLNA|nr:unnamed protein product [Cylicocyclus nassatus]